MSLYFGYRPAEASLLAGETDGMAVDFTSTSQHVLDRWNQTGVQVKTSSVDTFFSPHTFFTQSGTSPKYVKGSTYPLKWSPHNICLQSQTFDSASWAKNLTTISSNVTTAPDGSSTADKIIQNNATSGGYVDMNSTITLVAGFIYNLSVYAKAAEWSYTLVSFNSSYFAGGAAAYFNLSNGTVGTNTGSILRSGIVSVGSGWYRCDIAALCSTGGAVGDAPLIWVTNADGSLSTGNGTNGIYIWGAQVNRGSFTTSYIPTTTAAVIGLPISYGEGLQPEPAATNPLLQSQTFTDVAWAKSGDSITASGDVAPDGSTTASRIIENSTANTPHCSYNATALTLTAATYTWSIYMKAGSRGFGYLEPASGAGAITRRSIIVNLSTGAITATDDTGTPTVAAQGAIGVGNGWWRLYVTMTATADVGGSYLSFGACDASTPSKGFDTWGNPLWDGNGTGYILAWGAQIELNPVATSYVPTVAASATRAVDIINAPLASFPFSTTAGTVGTKFYPKISVGTSSVRVIWLLGTSTTGSPHVAYSTSSDFYWAMWGAAPSITDPGDPTIDADNISKASFISGDIRHRLNTTNVDNATAFTIVNNTTMYLGNTNGAASPFIGLIKNFVYVPRQVSDVDLPTWSFS